MFALLKLVYKSREYTHQQFAARHAPPVLPPTEPNPSGTRHVHSFFEGVQDSGTGPNCRPKPAERHQAEHGEYPRARPTALRPYECALHERIALHRDGKAGWRLWEGLGEARAQLDEQARDEDGEEERRGCCAE